jgi:hypothetical protein
MYQVLGTSQRQVLPFSFAHNLEATPGFALPSLATFDKSGNLLVVSYAGNGTVLALTPGASMGAFTVVPPSDAAPRPGLTAVRPVGDWRPVRDPATGLPVRRESHYVSPDGSTFMTAGRDFVTGATAWGVKSADLVRAFGLAAAKEGEPFYVTSESEVTTWRGTLGPDGHFREWKVFANQGGEGVAVDAGGRVFLAAGQILVYSPDGTFIETIRVPERPTQVVFGGKDGRTLFICARSSLYSVRVKTPGR